MLRLLISRSPILSTSEFFLFEVFLSLSCLSWLKLGCETTSAARSNKKESRASFRVMEGCYHTARFGVRPIRLINKGLTHVTRRYFFASLKSPFVASWFQEPLIAP